MKRAIGPAIAALSPEDKAELERQHKVAKDARNQAWQEWNALPEHLKLRKAPRNRNGEGTNKASRNASKTRYYHKKRLANEENPSQGGAKKRKVSL